MRRTGRKGNYLMTDDTLGWSVYASKVKRDYWGNETTVPLLRNLQEIASPLEDPQPVPVYRGPAYEYFNPCDAEVAPTYVGLTNVPTSQSNMAFQALDLAPGIGEATVGCTFIVQ